VFNRNAYYFDLLCGEASPFAGFGFCEIEPSIEVQKFFQAAELSILRVNDTFELLLGSTTRYASELDDLISSMWQDGWNPKEKAFNLFVRDLGLCFTYLMQREIGGQLVFRGGDTLDHLSLWWPDSRVEAFPFHKVAKALSEQHGESLDQMRNGVQAKLSLA